MYIVKIVTLLYFLESWIEPFFFKFIFLGLRIYFTLDEACLGFIRYQHMRRFLNT